MDNYNFGRSKEELVMRALMREGFNASLTKGSRGPFDVIGTHPDGSKILVQVKASRIGVANPIATQEDKSTLIMAAGLFGCKAYIAYVVGEKIEYEELI